MIRSALLVTSLVILAITRTSFGTSVQGHSSLHNEAHTIIDSSKLESFSSHVVIDEESIVKAKFPPKTTTDTCTITDDIRLDCHPESNANEKKCEARGCCWSTDGPKAWCYYPHNYGGYSYLNVSKTAYGLEAYLKRSFPSYYPEEVDVIKMIVKFETEDRLRVKILDANQSRFESPYPEVPVVDIAAINTKYAFIINTTKVGFQVVRKEDKVIIFDSWTVEGFIYNNQFIQISARFPTKYLYGLGEHRTSLLLSTDHKMMPTYNADQAPVGIQQFTIPNLYGAHPMYMALEQSGKAHGVFFLNTNAMEIHLQQALDITFRSIGGIMDFYFMMGPTPEKVIQQYTEIVGKPFMPPKWSLGFHLCRWGYGSLNNTKEVWKRTVDAGIPFDVQWNDIDYMKTYNDFTYDPVNYEGLPEFVEELHSMGMHYIPIVDPGVSGSEPAGTYPPYDKGIEMDIFVKNESGQPFIGKVWNPVSTVWPDFTNPLTFVYWTDMLKSQYDVYPFDGIWIDMNEPSNFLSGSTTGCPNSNLETPPYLPDISNGKLTYKTLCMTAKHYIGSHYDVHNMYALSEAAITNYALAKIRGKRPFIISRASFSGLGHYSGHWSGDVFSTWNDLKYSVIELLNFNIFGVPMMGADICGFNGNTTEELCQRWMELGAFYTFSRNHNTEGAKEQDPVAMGPEVVKSSVKALKIRYSLLPYLYTLFWKVHVDGGTVARPLFFEFTTDAETYGIEDQFLWGSSFMITPVLKEKVIALSPYFPAGIWYDFYNYSMISSTGEHFKVPAPLDTIPLFVRGGSILPMQEPAANIQLMNNLKIQLLVAPDKNGEALGSLYWDDGDSLDSVKDLKFTLLDFKLKDAVLTSTVSWSKLEVPPNLGRVTVLGISSPVNLVTVNDITTSFAYNETSKSLLVDGLNVTLTDTVVVKWQ